MASQATVTSKTGPGLTVTSLLLQNIKQFNLFLATKSVLEITDQDSVIKTFDINATTTLTCTISGGNATLVVSQ